MALPLDESQAKAKAKKAPKKSTAPEVQSSHWVEQGAGGMSYAPGQTGFDAPDGTVVGGNGISHPAGFIGPQVPGSAGNMTYAQIYSYALQAGFQPDVAVTVAAIAMAESGGRIGALHTNSNGTVDRGLMQINSIHGFDAQRLASDPLYNMMAAYKVYKQQGLNAWTTYKTGAYLDHLQSAAGTSPDIVTAANSGGLANQILGFATKYLGTPYVWGGESPKGFDCSGLVQYAYGHYGVTLPRTADQQYRVGTPVSGDQAQPGDLLFVTNGDHADHVMIYLGGGQALEAPHTGDHVKIVAADPHAYQIRRVLGPGASTGMAIDANGHPVYNVKAPTDNLTAALAVWGDGYSELLKQNPDLRNWLFRVMQSGMDPNSDGALQLLQQTDFWKNHTPGEVKQMLDTAASGAGAAANLPTWKQQIRDSAQQWGVPLSDGAVSKFASDVMWGRTDTTLLDEHFKQQALARFPGLHDEINRGITPQAFSQPYVQEMGNVLEMDPSSINYLNDPLVLKALQHTDADGKPAYMPLWQYQQMLKEDPRWMKTKNAHDSMMSAGLKVLNDMGLTSVAPSTDFGAPSPAGGF